MAKKPIQKLILSRLLQLPLILLAVYTVTFLLAWQIPGNPLEHEGRMPSPEVVEAMNAQYNLDSPVKFYVDYLWNAFGFAWANGEHSGHVFNLGPGLRHQNWTVNDILIAQLPVSMSIGLCSILLALFLGLAAGVVSAVKPKTFFDISKAYSTSQKF